MVRATRLVSSSLVGFVLLLGGCLGQELEPPAHTTQQAPIINGNLDTTHDAVVFVYTNVGACSGTIIEQSGTNAWVLTAAHCVVPNAPVGVIQGDSYQAGSAITYPVVDYMAHPSYGGAGGLYDFAVIRITGASASTPVIPAMSPAEDNLGPGTQIRHVGYGLISYPNGSTTQRHETINTINSVATAYFDYLQPTSGPCSGDSGGPALTITGAERVAGVISGGDGTCSQYGLDGRVSAVYDSFIEPFINGTPIIQTCNECFTAATSGTGACMAYVNACFGNSDCDALVQCFDGCSTNLCYQGCINSHPSGYNLYLAIFDCVCDTACDSECVNDDMCVNALGDPCSANGECQSGYCADGVCCNAPCTGQCEACDRPGSQGSCGAVTGDPTGGRPACADDGSVCGGTCDGANRATCTYPSDQTPCRALGCTDGTATLLAACDGAGTCPPGETVSCAPYLCNGDVCSSHCNSGADCAAGFTCVDGDCVGAQCVDDDNCPLGTVCAGGVCIVPQCQTDQDCAPGEICDAAACVTVECVTDLDCGAGQICRSGSCEVPPSVTPSSCACSAADDGPVPLPLVLALLGLLWLAHRRRRARA